MFFLGLLQCLVIWAMGQVGISLREKGARNREQAKGTPPGGWPKIAMLIPVSGSHPAMEAALHSLLEQDYPDYLPYIITATDTDSAMGLIERLKDEYPRLQHIVAGQAENCGQKNYNLLAGIRSAGPNVEVYAFCDSTHVAAPDFLRCLVLPVARGETAFSTGYHQVVPADSQTGTLGYALSVLFMRLLQGMTWLTQPWGGAMAIKRSAFEHYAIARLWETNVVDDCSLAEWLAKNGVHVHLAPGALLLTFTHDHALPLWRAWLQRQILFLKFCMVGQWLALGGLCLLMTIPPLWCAYAVLRGLLGLGGGMAPFLALCWLCLMAWVVNGWRKLLPGQASLSRWIWAFLCSCFMFAIVYMGTLWTNVIQWHNAIYHVGKGGVVRNIERH